MHIISARNGSLEVPVCILKVKQGYTARKVDIVYVVPVWNSGTKKKVPVWYTGPFRALCTAI